MTLNTRKQDPNKILKFIRDNAISTGAIAGILIALSVLFVALRSDDAKTPPPPPKKAEAEFHLEDAYAALFRHLRTDQVCYDEDRNGYFLHFSKSEDKADEGKVDPWLGWWFVNAPKFHHIKANNTWFLEEIADKEFIKVWPNVANMPCAEAKDYTDK